MKRSNGESIPKRERMIVLKKDLVAADPTENALCFLHALILPPPTQARNSGRAKHCWIAGVAGCHLTPDELSSAAESALAHRLLEDGDDPNDWSVSYVWASDDVYAVVLTCGVAVRAFTIAPEGEGYVVVEVTDRLG